MAARVHEAFVGALDENAVLHRLRFRVKFRAFHRAHGVIFIHHGAARAYHFAVFAREREAQARLPCGGNRRQVGYFKFVFHFALRAARAKRDV